MRVGAIEGTARWTRHARELQGPGFARFQRELTRYNSARLRAQLPDEAKDGAINREAAWARAEIQFVETLRRSIAPLIAKAPSDADGFLAWFEALKHSGPGQGDPLFPFLAEAASLEQMKWFLWQEIAGEA